MRRYPAAGVAVPEVLLPREGVDVAKWAVVACDQYTSEPEYWEQVTAAVGNAPSTLHLIYPEVHLGEKDPQIRINEIRKAMQAHLDAKLLTPHDGIVYVERDVEGRTRKGLVLAVDLEQYDYHKGSTSLIRATEGTILDRIPPRVRIRRGAPLELPHIMVLIDDPDDTVIGPLSAAKDRLRSLYDFELMMSSGHLSGHLVDDRSVERAVMDALAALADPESFHQRYGFRQSYPVLLYAMGDGNHSLATAKAIWEHTKESLPDHDAALASPARHALVELVNLHDDSLIFEPIHRVIFDVPAGRDPLAEMEVFYAGRFRVWTVESLTAMRAQVDAPPAGVHRIGMVEHEGFRVIEVERPDSNLPVGTLQAFLDPFIKDGGAGSVDYVHGTATVVSLGRAVDNRGFYLPAMNKHELFKSVILDGALPRKTFSMGEAHEKRFYMECRELS